MYNKLTENDLGCLAAIVGANRAFIGGDISEDYSHDELGGVKKFPEILLKVHTVDEISRIMAYADEHRIPVAVRGSGTGLVGGCVAVEGGIMLDTTLMNKILELDEENMTVTVQPGVLLMELASFAAENGYLYPPDPGEKSATIGGNISTNAGGMRAVKYGVTRDYVRGLTVILPNGSVLTLGGKIVKNSSGYSLKDLIIGSEGTLAVVGEAVMKLVPLPEYSVSLLVAFSSMEAAIETVPEIMKSKAAPTAVEYMSRETILFAEDYLGKRFPDTGSDAYLLLTFDGSSKERVEAEYGFAANLCLEKGALDAFIVDTPERKASVWNARGAFLEAIKASTTMMDECDVVVPRSRIAEFIKFTHEVSKRLDMRIPSFGHAGDGNLHIYICRDALCDTEWKKRLAEAFDLMYNKAAEMGGLVSGEHGIGYAKKEYLLRQYGSEHLALMNGIKQVFDPNNILNPQKVCQ